MSSVEYELLHFCPDAAEKIRRLFFEEHRDRSLRIYDLKYGLISVCPRGNALYLVKQVRGRRFQSYLSTPLYLNRQRLESARRALHHKIRFSPCPNFQPTT